jgi:hypothetical protein
MRHRLIVSLWRNRKGPGHKKQEWRRRKEQTHTIDKIGKILYVNRVKNKILSNMKQVLPGKLAKLITN